MGVHGSQGPRFTVIRGTDPAPRWLRLVCHLGRGCRPRSRRGAQQKRNKGQFPAPPKIPISHLSIKNRRKTHLTAAEQLTSQAQGSCAGAEDESLRILPPGQREDQVNRPNLEGGMIWETSEPVPRGRVGCGMRLVSGSFWGLL